MTTTKRKIDVLEIWEIAESVRLGKVLDQNLFQDCEDAVAQYGLTGAERDLLLSMLGL